MTQKFSAYSGVWRALYRLLNAGPWPSNPSAAGPFKVVLASWGKDEEPLEGVLISTSTSTLAPDVQDYATVGWRRTEDFTTEVIIRSTIPNTTEWGAVDRIEQLTQAAETIIQSAMTAAALPTEVTAWTWWWKPQTVEVGIWPMPEGGFGAAAKITIQVHAIVGGR